MTEYLRNQWQQLVSFWQGLETRQQWISVGIVSVAGLVVAGLLYWSMQPQWVVLYNRELEAQEASKIATELENLDVAYQLDGNVIKVPFSRVDRLRLELAESGIQPTTTVGFEIFEKGGIGITDFERQIRYKRALEGSLSRSIESNPDIEEAQVHISIPRQQALFKEDEEPVRASVKLKMEPYSRLNQEKIRGIINLVSYGVVGLEQENVAVLDQNDRLLSDFKLDDGGLSSTKVKQLEVKERIERKLEQKLRTSLGRVLTPDRMSTAVTVSMDFDRIEKKLEHYRQPEDAFEQLKASERQITQTLNGEQLPVGGPAGSESNIPGAETSDTGGMENYTKEKSVVNYFADRNVTTITRDPAITRVSALVTVDGQYDENTQDNGEVVFAYNPPTENEMEKIRRLAEAAIGFNPDRGDQLEVTHLQFDRSQEFEERREQLHERQFQRQVAYFVAGAMGLFLLIGGGIFWWWRRGQEEAEEEPIRSRIPSRDATQSLLLDRQEKEEVGQRIQETARENPETVAQILRGWLSENE